MIAKYPPTPGNTQLAAPHPPSSIPPSPQVSLMPQVCHHHIPLNTKFASVNAQKSTGFGLSKRMVDKADHTSSL